MRVIYLQNPTVFWLSVQTISLSYLSYMAHLGLQRHLGGCMGLIVSDTAVSRASAFEVELAIEKLKSHKSPDIDQTPAELVKKGGRTISPDICKLINSIWNKEKFHDEWKQSIKLPNYKNGDKTL